MFKRLFWLMVGAGFGFGASFWVMRAVRNTVERYAPERVTKDATAAARRIGTDVKEAVVAGRQAMRDFERDARTQLTTNGSAAEVGTGN
jgi:hypothetical protein